jgi:hypothetical protein
MDKATYDSIKTGDYIKFRAVTRHSNARVWRKVTGFWPNGYPTVRYHGTGSFVVQPYEISEVSETKPAN